MADREPHPRSDRFYHELVTAILSLCPPVVQRMSENGWLQTSRLAALACTRARALESGVTLRVQRTILCEGSTNSSERYPG